MAADRLAPAGLLPAVQRIDAQYTVGIIPFVSVSAAVALSRISDSARRRTLAVTVVMVSVLTYALLSLDSPGRQRLTWARRDQVDAARISAARLVPEAAQVSATEGMLPLLVERGDVYKFPVPFEGVRSWNDPVPPDERRRDLRYIVLDTANRVQWTPHVEHARHRVFPRLRLQEVFSREGILVYRVLAAATDRESPRR